MGKPKKDRTGLLVGLIVFGAMLTTFVILLASGLLSFNFALGV